MRGGAGRAAQARADIQTLRVRELQIVLGDLNLPRSGRKQELIDRISHALEQFEAKATENVSNHATSAFYNDQLSAGLRSIDAQVRLSRPNVYQARALAAAGAVALGGGPNSGLVTPPPTTGAAYHHHRGGGVSQAHRHGHGTTAPGYVRSNVHFNGAATTTGAAPMAMPSSGIDVLVPTKPASLEGARCFCGGEAASGKVVKCRECGLRVHAKCHQLVTAAPEEWYCEGCRATLFDPFLQVKKTVLPAKFVRFNRSQMPLRIEFTISDQDLSDLYNTRDPKPGAMTPGCLELQLRCFVLKEELGTGTSWPTTSQMSANGFTLQITQRAPPGQSNPSKVLRELPTNVFPFSRVGRNVIEIRTNESPLIYVFMIQIVEFRALDTLIEDVKTASASITYEDAQQTVIKSFGDEDEDDIVTTCTILSVRCPLGLCVITLPARGVHCKHLQCFDLKTFLTFNKKARSRHYRCTVCHNFIKASDLRIDPYLKKLLADVQGEEDLEEVEILPDATWKRRLAEEPAPPPPQKKVKTEATSEGISNGSSSTAVDDDSGVIITPLEIDLSLTSDEEDGGDVDPGAMAPSTSTVPVPDPSSAHGLQPSHSSTATLSDDEVAILTVDSDIWETPGDESGGVTQQVSDGLVPFPMDLFQTFPGNTGGNPVDLSSSAWNQGYGVPPAPANLYGAPMPWVSDVSGGSTSTSTSTSSEADLASAMAHLSRNHPHVSNPFQQRPQVPPKPPRASAALDVICLLDSDSD